MKAYGSGLVCGACGGETAVSDSRAGEEHIRRRRRCLACGRRFTTVEAAVPDYTRDIKQSQVGRAMELYGKLDALPYAQREIVTKLIAAFSEEKQG